MSNKNIGKDFSNKPILLENKATNIKDTKEKKIETKIGRFLIKKTVLKKAQNGATEAPTKSKERWNASGQFYEPTRRNQIIF